MGGKNHENGRLRRLGLSIAGATLAAAVLFPATAAAEPRAIAPPALAGVPSLPGPLAAPAKPAAKIGLLKATPDVATVGTKFNLTGEGLPPSKSVDIVWDTVKGSYVMDSLPDTVEFWGRQLDAISVVLARATTDASGKFSVQLSVPEDYGELHDIYAVVDGVQVAKGGVRIKRAVTITPLKGAIGTPITITVTGLGWKPFESTAAVLYDNKYAGFIASTTTRGTATVQIRAAGPVGSHTIEVAPASHAVPYLNIEQSPVYFVGKYRFGFTVTKDNGPPKAFVDWPEQFKPFEISKTAGTAAAATGVTASLSSASGPILSKLDLKASGLTPGTPVQLAWVTAEGARASSSGWALTSAILDLATKVSIPGAQTMPERDGSLEANFTVPDGLGGWHAVQLLQNGKVRAEVPYFVERSLVGVAPLRVKEGEQFTIHLKGIGWTELDNGFAVVYDNGYIGYACGFNSRGDVTMNLVAKGGPGTHLVDLYPMIYKGKGKGDAFWQTEIPILNFKKDAPGLALGYRLPTFRLAIQIVK